MSLREAALCCAHVRAHLGLLGGAADCAGAALLAMLWLLLQGPSHDLLHIPGHGVHTRASWALLPAFLGAALCGNDFPPARPHDTSKLLCIPLALLQFQCLHRQRSDP